MNNQKCISCDTNKHTDKCICNNERRCRTCKDCRWFIDNDYNGSCIEKNSRPYRPYRPYRPDRSDNKKTNYIIAGSILGFIYLLYIILIITEYKKI